MKKKYVIGAAVLALMAVLTSGCGREPEEKSSIDVFSEEEPGTEQMEEAGTEQTQEEPGTEQTQKVQPEEDGPEKVQPEEDNPEKILIGGKVRSIAKNSFVLSLTLWEDAEDGKGSTVVIPQPGSPEEELVSVRCGDLVVYELWTIQGGGAGIQKEEASFSEIQEGTGLEAEGHYEGDEFVADKVIIEVYE